MTQTEYDQKKREYWGEYFKYVVCGNDSHKYWFNRIFDCAYALGKQDKDAEGEEMLTVSSNSVRAYKENIDRYRPNAVRAYDKGFWIGAEAALQDLFGSKCLRNESASESASEPKSETDKCFDSILKDSFRNERRLNIAAMAMQGILSNPQLLKIAIETYQEEIGSPDIYVAVAKTAKAQADALIAECEKGGKS